jgi:hypothetical protein
MTIIAYGPAIHDALARKETTLQELQALREHAQTVLAAQGDLEGALQRLNSEIARRQGK